MTEWAGENRSGEAYPLDIGGHLDWLMPLVTVETDDASYCQSLRRFVPGWTTWDLAPKDARRVRVGLCWDVARVLVADPVCHGDAAAGDPAHAFAGFLGKRSRGTDLCPFPGCATAGNRAPRRRRSDCTDHGAERGQRRRTSAPAGTADEGETGCSQGTCAADGRQRQSRGECSPVPATNDALGSPRVPWAGGPTFAEYFPGEARERSGLARVGHNACDRQFAAEG